MRQKNPPQLQNANKGEQRLNLRLNTGRLASNLEAQHKIARRGI